SPPQMRLYIDGHQRGSASVSGFSLPSGSGNLNIGAAADGNQKLVGFIDDARVTAAPLYNADFSRPYPLSPVSGTRALWHFNNDYADSAGTNTGKIIGSGASFSADVPPSAVAMSTREVPLELTQLLAGNLTRDYASGKTKPLIKAVARPDSTRSDSKTALGQPDWCERESSPDDP
ncbi:MAG TPA: LamG-like jellyroll fold domain-containing protein, partial [Blastocatellia bacterium]|nr:LamG-like jellyroll fold domain-containing protein [Blastocatellia bacterium]